MSDVNGMFGFPVCTYCGNRHNYSPEKCRDLNTKWNGKPIDLEAILAGKDDTIRTLRLANGRLREAASRIMTAYRQGGYFGEMQRTSDFADLDAALSTPGDGLWEEVRHLCEMVLRLKVGDEMELPILQAASAVLGRKP